MPKMWRNRRSTQLPSPHWCAGWRPSMASWSFQGFELVPCRRWWPAFRAPAHPMSCRVAARLNLVLARARFAALDGPRHAHAVRGIVSACSRSSGCSTTRRPHARGFCCAKGASSHCSSMSEDTNHMLFSLQVVIETDETHVKNQAAAPGTAGFRGSHTATLKSSEYARTAASPPPCAEAQHTLTLSPP